MKKDVIYIDIEDDITAVIEKVKAAGEKIVALVPPKGNAVLQSVVNLKLLKRAAGQSGKQPVIVTNNQALTALAGGLGLYVAKNLQSKPQVPGATEAAPQEETVEVSDQSEALTEAGTSVPLSRDASDEVELSSEELAGLEAADQASESAATPKKKPKKAKKIPNFNSFRKKLLIGGLIALLLVVALLAVFGRAKANIVVRAETTPVDVAFDAQLNANSSASDPENYNLKASSQEKKQTLSESFTPTGQKDIGEKATGTVRFVSDSFSALSRGITIPAGTSLRSNGGKSFLTNETVRLSLAGNEATTGVTAAESGPSFNGASGSLSGAPNSVSANLRGSTSGGSTQVVKVVSQEDVNKARATLEQQDTNAVKDELRKAFGDGVTVLEDSFVANLGNIRSEPAVGEQTNEAKLTAEATYTMLGIPDEDLGAALDAYITSEMPNEDQQRVYENGLKSVKFEKLSQEDRVATYKITALGHYGPQFDTEKLKEDSAGKKFGEVRAYLQDLPGVKGVDINLSPFWARKLPNPNRIDIKLDVDSTSGQ